MFANKGSYGVWNLVSLCDCDGAIFKHDRVTIVDNAYDTIVVGNVCWVGIVVT